MALSCLKRKMRNDSGIVSGNRISTDYQQQFYRDIAGFARHKSTIHSAYMQAILI
jgi:hypothetical protein